MKKKGKGRGKGCLFALVAVLALSGCSTFHENLGDRLTHGLAGLREFYVALCQDQEPRYEEACEKGRKSLNAVGEAAVLVTGGEVDDSDAGVE